MAGTQLPNDPYNIIITGVGGQGNVMASRVLANMLVKKGYHVTIGETFGASQRGGSVMSHLRVSKKDTWSPQIPKGKAHVIVALEPTEAIRVLANYGNPDVKVVSNTRPIHAAGVIAGDINYPALEETKKTAREMSSGAWFINATDEALKLGNPILGNIIMLGALSGLDDLPLDKEDFREVIAESLPQNKVDINMEAFDLGRELLKE
jgi:indolepyruvate ferredoxin oxidoreductase beta subunit